MNTTFHRELAGPYAASPFARRVFNIAGIYGLIAMLPQYFLEAKIDRDIPPAITHPEYFYGFIGIVVAWQIAFLVIASDTRRYRPLMLAAVLEKLVFVGAIAVLLVKGRVAGAVVGFAGVDLLLAICFITAYFIEDSSS